MVSTMPLEAHTSGDILFDILPAGALRCADNIYLEFGRSEVETGLDWAIWTVGYDCGREDA